MDKEDKIITHLIAFEARMEKRFEALEGDARDFRDEVYSLFDATNVRLARIELEVHAFNSYRGRTDTRIEALEEHGAHLNERVTVLESVK